MFYFLKMYYLFLYFLPHFHYNKCSVILSKSYDNERISLVLFVGATVLWHAYPKHICGKYWLFHLREEETQDIGACLTAIFSVTEIYEFHKKSQRWPPLPVIHNFVAGHKEEEGALCPSLNSLDIKLLPCWGAEMR